MKQAYLSTRDLDQFISPSFASLTREIFLIQVTSVEITVYHFEGYDNILGSHHSMWVIKILTKLITDAGD